MAMRAVQSLALVVAAVALAAGCTRRNEAYCCTDPLACDEVVMCADSARPFCDNEGAYDASGGVGRTCIPLPGNPCTGDTCDDPQNPVCFQGVCVACGDSQDCAADAPVCGELDHVCAGCESEADCARFADRPLCDNGACVGCRSDADCGSETAPVCDQDDQTCRACAAHGECSSGVCDIAEGSCVADSDTLHVDPDGADAGDCSMASPCETLQYAVEQVEGARMWILVHPGSYSDTVLIEDRTVRIIGSGAELTALLAGTPVLRVLDSDVEVDGLTLRDAGGGADPTLADGVRCGLGAGPTAPRLVLREVLVTGNSGQGVDSISCQLRIERSTFRENEGGGLRSDGGGFIIVNNFIVDNGQPAGSLGGARLDGPAGSRFEHNTVVGNQVADGVTPGVDCNGTLALVNNIIYGNSTDNNDDQVDGSCSHEYSLIGPRSQDGQGNVSSAPDFVAQVDGDYHLAGGSRGIDEGTPGTVSVDIDGEPRPAGDAPDIGADEVQ